MSEETYDKLADYAMELLIEQIESEDLLADIEGFDAHYADGVLTLRLGPHGIYVVNKQPPNQEIWLSSPVRYFFLCINSNVIHIGDM